MVGYIDTPAPMKCYYYLCTGNTTEIEFEACVGFFFIWAKSKAPLPLLIIHLFYRLHTVIMQNKPFMVLAGVYEMALTNGDNKTRPEFCS